MRLAVLDTGHDRPAALTLRLMSWLTRSDPPEIVSLGCYRHRFFGTPFFDMNAAGAGPLDGQSRDVAVHMVRHFGYRNPLMVRLLSRAG